MRTSQCHWCGVSSRHCDVLPLLVLLTACLLATCARAACTETTCFTESQRSNTRMFLTVLRYQFKGAVVATWTQSDFCQFSGLTCDTRGFSILLDNENMSGSLPEIVPSVDLSQVPLTSFSVANNPMSGVLPTTWGGLVSLVSLNVAGTSIYGTIPDSWGGMTSLTTVSMDSTELTCCLPFEWLCELRLTTAGVGLTSAASAACATATTVCVSLADDYTTGCSAYGPSGDPTEAPVTSAPDTEAPAPSFTTSSTTTTTTSTTTSVIPESLGKGGGSSKASIPWYAIFLIVLLSVSLVSLIATLVCFCCCPGVCACCGAAAESDKENAVEEGVLLHNGSDGGSRGEPVEEMGTRRESLVSFPATRINPFMPPCVDTYNDEDYSPVEKTAFRKPSLPDDCVVRV